MSNVIVFMSDEHNPLYSSPYGHDFVDTPNMQWLADHGTLFEHAYCPSPLCVPSRSAFLTGKRVHAVKAYGNSRGGTPPDFESGARVATPVDLHDLQASVFSLTGAEQPENWLGTPLGTLASDDRDRIVFAEYHGHGARAGSLMVRRGDWKLIHNVEAPHQLFDLGDDPDELENQYEACRPKAEELAAALAEVCDPAVENREAEAFWESQLRLQEAEAR